MLFRYESTEAVKVTLPEGDVDCTAAAISCKDAKYPEGSDANKMKALCAEPSGGIFETALTCTGPPNPADAQCNVEAIQLIYAASFEVYMSNIGFSLVPCNLTRFCRLQMLPVRSEMINRDAPLLLSKSRKFETS